MKKLLSMILSVCLLMASVALLGACKKEDASESSSPVSEQEDAPEAGKPGIPEWY